jgi:hypothetical protein
MRPNKFSTKKIRPKGNPRSISKLRVRIVGDGFAGHNANVAGLMDEMAKHTKGSTFERWKYAVADRHWMKSEMEPFWKGTRNSSCERLNCGQSQQMFF